ncbi:MAG: trehalose-phosphatase [Candidatus Krumholzibacteriales bacterium]
MRNLTGIIREKDLFSDIPEDASFYLLLDYDGTLAPFRREQDRAFPYPGINEILGKLITRDRIRLIIISGRPVDHIMKLLKLETCPEIWGCHGSERYTPGGEYTLNELPPEAGSDLEKAYRAVERAGLSEFCEKKPTSLAVHWRGLTGEKKELIRKTAEREWNRLAGENGLTIHEFDGGIELRFSEINKGNVTRNLIEEADDSDHVLYFGDDYTDEDAFRALKGSGISFLVREDFRETEADFWITPPGELIMILEKLWSMCGDING